MITLQNLTTEYPKIAQNTLPEVLRNKEYSFVQENLDLYDEDDSVKELVDVFIQKLNAVIEKNKKKNTEKAVITTKAKGKTGKESVITTIPDIPKNKEETPKKTVSKNRKDKKAKTDKPVNTEQVAKIIPEIVFIKRYLLLNGKTKTKEQIVAFIKSLQKAIVEKTIRKTSEYANIIEDIQDELLKCYKLMDNKIALTISPNKFLQYKGIVEGVAVHPAVKFIKRFISLFGVQDEQVKAQRAERLLCALEKQIETLEKDSTYGKAITEIYDMLEHYLDKESSLTISEQKLNGLMGLAGVSDGLGNVASFLAATASNLLANVVGNAINGKPQSAPLNGTGETILLSTDIVKMEFQTLNFEGEFKELIGNPSLNFSAMVYGMPGSGKTTFCILFAKYLAENHSKKVLFATIEEGINHTFRNKLTRLQAYHPALVISDHIPDRMDGMDVLFIDSVNAFNLSAVDLKNLRKQYPNMIIIEILQCTKDGKFKGSQEYEHDVDVVISVVGGVASTVGHKNRFGKSGEMQVW